MGPAYVVRAAVFGLVACAVGLLGDWIANDVLRWAWLLDPAHVPFGWTPPHFAHHRSHDGATLHQTLLR